MTDDQLATIADKQRRRHEVLETLDPALPWHPEHPDMQERLRRGELPLSKRPVAVLDDDRVHLFGPCLETVRAGLRQFLGRLVEAREAAKAEVDLIGHGLRYQDCVVKMANRALAQPPDHLCLPQVDWNCCLHALAEVGVQVVLCGTR